MVQADYDPIEATGRIVLRPNRSWTWRANLYFLASLCVVSLTTAVLFTTRGLWVVLPFTGLELMIFAAALYYCVRRTHSQEVLTFSEQELRIEKGHEKPEQTYVFKRFFSRVLIDHPSNPRYNTHVAIQARKRKVEIGRFLAPDDKQELIRQLRQMVHRFQ